MTSATSKGMRALSVSSCLGHKNFFLFIFLLSQLISNQTILNYNNW